MDRQHRRELKHDKFVDELGTLSTRARENQRLLMLLTAALVVLSVIGYGIYFYRSDREQKAQDALAKAIETIDSPLQMATTPGTPPNPAAKFKTEAERGAAAEKQFKDVQTSYPGSDAADVANLYLCRFDASRGDIPAARKKLQDFIDSHPKSVLVGSARYSLYQLRIENKEAQQVANELQGEIAKNDPALPPDTILVLLAHAYDAQGNNEKSKETYRRITTEFPDSPYALEAQRRAGPVA
jgi:TolA-binding protein